MIAFLNNIIFNSHIPCIIIITLSNKSEQVYKSTLHYNCQPNKIKNIQHYIRLSKPKRSAKFILN